MRRTNGDKLWYVFIVTFLVLLVNCQQLTSPQNDKFETNYIFPESMKGYELYGWVEDGENYFTIITGTNRNKSVEEIRSDDCLTVGNAWSKIKVKGIEALQNVAKQIPKGETIIWMGGLPDYPTISNDLVMNIKKYFESLGLVFLMGN
jgi:hypothetical protein